MGHSGEPTDSSLPREARRSPPQREAWQQLTLQYLRDLPRQLDVVVRLLAKEDYNAIREHAHRMKGTSGTYRLDSIAEHLARLECLAVDHDAGQIAHLVDAIASQIEAAAKAIDSPAGRYDGGNLGETDD